MPTPTLTLGLQELIFPDIGHDPGTLLRDRLRDMFEFISDNIFARRSSGVAMPTIGDTFVFNHKLNIQIAEIRFDVFSVEDDRFLTPEEKDLTFTFTNVIPNSNNVTAERIASGFGPNFYFFASYIRLSPPLGSNLVPSILDNTSPGQAGISESFAREDHIHELNLSVFAATNEPAPVSSGVSGTVGISTNYAREDHGHDLSISSFASSVEPGVVSSTASGAAGISANYARADHNHDLNLSSFNGPISSDAAHLGGYGLVPVGTIVAYNPGFYTNGTNGGFTAVGPAGNTVAQVNTFLNAKGWYVCNGAAVNVASTPIWNAAGRFLPKLDDTRFLAGSTTAGTQAGANSVSLVAGNIPTLSVSGSTVANTSGVAGSHSHTMPHTHSIDHDHASANTNTTGSHGHTMRLRGGNGTNALVHNSGDNRLPSNADNTWDATNFDGGPLPSILGGGDHAHSLDLPAFAGTSGAASSSTTNTEANHSHSIPVLTVSASYTNGSVAAVSTLPQYLATYFIVRVF